MIAESEETSVNMAESTAAEQNEADDSVVDAETEVALLPDINSVAFENMALEKIDVSENSAQITDLSDPIVDGSWRKNVHQGVITNTAMKNGAVYAGSAAFMKGMTGHPEFHGYSWHNNPSSTTFGAGTCNYIANYNYMVKLAQSYAKGRCMCTFDF